ncbi:LOW QUALITY PROTEIN: uncharacterized protein fbxo44.9 [Ctenopharyngodon idella]|uniref:LOW QUALITY PROTEIN: uncharacterized protein fbxo44.9 n=1 Tax=Ctenopharyngodon idella TaxID=7959 RepID=UPI002231872E|nr:LOW QUALITY PROTEIN: uncharacterized protein fbxo44.9 [Ctenopharyngodon idella]
MRRSRHTKVSNKGPMSYQKTRMGQSVSGHIHVASRQRRSDKCTALQSDVPDVPLAVVEEILLNLPAHQVVRVCRLVCREWKELVDSASHWRERCRREEIQPCDASRPPEDWRLFYFLAKNRRNLLKNPRAEDGLQGWRNVQNGGDWVAEENRKPFPDNSVTKCFTTSHRLCMKEQLIDLEKEGYSAAFMDQQQPHIKISDWYTPLSLYRSHYQISVELLDQEKKAICGYRPYKVFFHQGDNYPWCPMTHVFRNYGCGVRFIRFTHGGLSGIRLTNSSVEICPAAERLRCTKSNLLKNPSAQDGLRGWKIVRSRGEWVTEENRKPLPDTVTKCFITSYGVCLKRQLIDLEKEGYSDAFMDQVQPHIKISDWYAPRFDCGSEYQICVELLDQGKNSIRTFQPEKVIFSFRNSEPWCQMTHVFKDYGPGVRFIRFTHGGKDTQFWAGHYGIRVTNSSVEIYSAEGASLTNRNLLKNPSAQSGFEGWEIVQNGGDHWVISENRRTFPVSDCFVTSYGLCLKQQLIDLKKEGYSAAFMDQQQPHIRISDWYAPRTDCGSEYQICVELLDEKKKPIRTFQPEKVFFQQGKSEPWSQMTHVFMDYGPGVRFICFTHGGKDTKFWKGQHGIQCTALQSDVPDVPLAVVEEILLYLPAHQVVRVCRLVCGEWKELVDSASHWRERCRREGIQPCDASRPPKDWRLFYCITKKRRNLLKNPRAEEKFNGWTIVQNGGDCWTVEDNYTEIPNHTVPKYFVTSYRLCLKRQLIDLEKEGYSAAFMDQVQPHIKISDWYAPRCDCGSEYQIRVELLDRKKKPISTFEPKNVFFQQWNDQQWCEMTHVFKDYGPGVLFIRFTHGGKDTQFWAGWYGIRVTNSSVEICPVE